MWFAKFFGGRSGQDDDEQPTATPAQQTQAPLGAAARLASQPPAKRRSSDVQRKGFDPYNSGAFQRRNAWERVVHRR
jgi:hypothetical protein